MLVKTFGAALQGIDAIVRTREVAVSRGDTYSIVGLPDTAIKESNERVRSAMRESGFEFPRRTVVVNLAPADVRKEGSAYDLPIAIGVLTAAEEITVSDIDRCMMMGELSLDGSLLPIKGVLPMAIEARRAGFKSMIVPKANATEAAVVNDIDVYGAENLTEVIDFLSGQKNIKPTVVNTREEFAVSRQAFDFDFRKSRVRKTSNAPLRWPVPAATTYCSSGHPEPANR